MNDLGGASFEDMAGLSTLSRLRQGWTFYKVKSVWQLEIEAPTGIPEPETVLAQELPGRF